MSIFKFFALLSFKSCNSFSWIFVLFWQMTNVTTAAVATSVGVKDHAANVTAEDFCLPSVKRNSSAPSSTSKMDKELSGACLIYLTIGSLILNKWSIPNFVLFLIQFYIKYSDLHLFGTYDTSHIIIINKHLASGLWRSLK